MRGQNEGLGALKGRCLDRAADHAGPVNAVVDAKRPGPLAQGSAEPVGFRPGHNEVERGIARGVVRESVKQKIAALLFVNSPEIEKIAPPAEARQDGGQSAGIAGPSHLRTIGDKVRAKAGPWKSARGKPLFQSGGEQDLVGMVQDRALGREPRQALGAELHRRDPREVGIHHPVSVNDIRQSCRPDPVSSPNDRVIPQAVDHCGIEPRSHGSDPAAQPWDIAAAEPAGAKWNDLGAKAV